MKFCKAEVVMNEKEGLAFYKEESASRKEMTPVRKGKNQMIIKKLFLSSKINFIAISKWIRQFIFYPCKTCVNLYGASQGRGSASQTGIMATTGASIMKLGWPVQ